MSNAEEAHKELANTSTSAHLLVQARGFISLDGWVQGDYGNPLTGWCAVGALESVANAWWEANPNEGDPFPEARNRLHEAVAADLPDSLYVTRATSLVVWNDRPGRTKTEVLAAYDKAIEGGFQCSFST